MISTKNKFKINSISLTNFVFAFFPISFILGNFATNANVIVFCFLGIYNLKHKILRFNLNYPLKFIFLFFLLVFFSTSLSLINSFYFSVFEDSNFNRFIKSILFFRYFLILLVVYLLSESDIINFKYFFITAALSPFLISADVIFQYTFGYNIVGLPGDHHNTSFFGDERISGGFIQNFSFFTLLFSFYFFRKNKKYIKIFLTSLIVCILSMGIIVSGNRIPFFLFLIGLIFLLIFNKKLRLTMLVGILVLLATFKIITFYDDYIKLTYKSFYDNVNHIAIHLSERIKSDKSEIILLEKNEVFAEPETNGHRKLFFTAIEVWKLNKIFGNGIKSFREDCHKIIKKQSRGMCSNHPHNYYVEILTDTGIVGIFLVLFMGFVFFVFLRKNYQLFGNTSPVSLFFLSTIISFILQIFPIRSTGSIFTTNNTTFIILLVAIIISYKKLLKGKNFK